MPTEIEGIEWLNDYMADRPDQAREVIRQLSKIEFRSVNANREVRIVLWRMAGKIADSGFRVGRTHEQIYDEIQAAFPELLVMAARR